MTMINQKEYLKKYMSSGDSNEKKKKKKKKLKTGTQTVKIIDDDIDLKNMRPIKEDEFDILLEGEDAPQIAGIVDDSGPVDFTDKRRWKIVAEDGDLTVSNRTVEKKKRNRDDDETNANKSDDLDLSPPRSKSSKKNKHASPSPREQSKDDDLSPPRFKHTKDKQRDSSSRKRAHNDDSDLSPPRKSKNDDSDLSPPRSKSKNYDSDLSPLRQSRNNDDSDLSPPRSTKHRSSTHNTGRRYRSNKEDDDSDLSPPRKDKRNLDTNEHRKDKDGNSDLIRSRRKEHRSRRHTSPHSNFHKDDDRGYEYRDRNSSKHDVSRSNRDKREREYEDRKSRSDTRDKRKKKSRWNDETDDVDERGHTEDNSKDRRMTKTLDGKIAGLQNAEALREETEIHKRREMEQFNEMSKIVSGEGQAPKTRKTGRKRKDEAEAAEKREQEKRQRELNDKYDKWGKGLKQLKDREERLQSDLYEMNKPLARYADDADLDKQLREELKEGDPMLEYIKQKQIKEGKRNPDPPQYQGSYAPNRFGIKPGYRWDGVDRSNGFEKKWFETQNAKKALQEEAYKWSTADM